MKLLSFSSGRRGWRDHAADRRHQRPYRGHQGAVQDGQRGERGWLKLYHKFVRIQIENSLNKSEFVSA
jgi:hypothetical protein